MPLINRCLLSIINLADQFPFGFQQTYFLQESWIVFENHVKLHYVADLRYKIAKKWKIWNWNAKKMGVG